jgi:hypothetical protein
MAMTPIRDQVEARFLVAWPNARPEIRARLVAFLLGVFDRYLQEHLDDPHFITELLSTKPEVFRQRLSELLMADWLWRNGFSLTSPSKGHGPDFRVQKGRHSAWLELYTPEPQGIDPLDLTSPAAGEFRARSEPFKERLLRWTQGLQGKRAQLEKHITAGIVKPGEACVIAINAQMLNPIWSDITGISGRPVPVELGFGAGPRAVTWRPDTGFEMHFHTTYRPTVVKTTTANVDTHVFQDPQFNHVSAVLGVALHDHGYEGKPYPSAVVHNPNAETRLPSCWLPSLEHWTGKDYGTHWRLRRHHPPKRRRMS